MVASIWCPGAERLKTSHLGGDMDGLGGPRVVWHRTVGGNYESNIDELSRKGFEPHILWDPRRMRPGGGFYIGQFLPANRSAYALEHPKNTPATNGHGSVCIQIEVVDNGEMFEITDTPMYGYHDILLPWFRSWGVPDACPGGPFPPIGTSGDRSITTWMMRPGHYGHSQIPNNNHTDPGVMDLLMMFGDAEMTEQDKQDIADKVVKSLESSPAIIWRLEDIKTRTDFLYDCLVAVARGDTTLKQPPWRAQK